MKGAAPPGPSTPALLQTCRWMLRPPLALLEEHRRRYGDVFRMEVLGPRYRDEPGSWSLTRRTVVVFSSPGQVQEIFAKSGDELAAGRAREFLEWFMGPRSIMVLDGEPHRQERRELSPLFTPERLLHFEQTMRAAATRALDRWPRAGAVDLHRLLDLALEEMNLALAVGTTPEQDGRLLALTRRARQSFSAPIHFVPLLRANLGPWSPGGRLAAFRSGLRDVVLDRIRSPESSDRSGDSCLLGGLIAHLRGRVPTEAELAEMVDRIIALLGGMDNTSAAIAWACRHLLRDPAASERVRDEVRRCPEDGIPGAGSFLEAVLLESLRLTPPIPAVIRRANGPVSISGFDLAPGTFILASLYLLHRREDLFPEPEAFKPERFLGSTPRGSFAPFGGGARSCLGGALAVLQMRVLLSETWRRFDIEPAGSVSLAETRRNVTVVPAGPLRATLRALGPAAEVPGPGWPAPVQTLLGMQKSLERDRRYLRKYGDIYALRLLLPRQQRDGPGLPLLSGKVVVVSSPKLMREVWTQASPALAGGEGRQFTEWFLGATSLLVTDGEEHRQERRMLLSLFTPERVARSEERMRGDTARALARLPAPGHLRLTAFLDDLIPELGARLMFGAIDEHTVQRLQHGVLRAMTSLAWSVPLLLFPVLRRDVGPWSPGGRAARVLADFRKILADQVRRVRAGTAAPDTWLSQLLELEGEDQLEELEDRRVSRVLTILAGGEIVVAALAWSCYHLLSHPEMLARACDEARSDAAISPDQRPYLVAACQEAARIHPPIPILTRRVVAPVTLGGYPLDPGTWVVGSLQLAHHRPEIFPEPDRFRPERFLDRTYSPYEYLPFGGGVRRCLGQAIGFRQVCIVLAELLRRFDLEPLGHFKGGMRRRAVAMLPRDPLRVAVRRRT